MKFSIKNTSRKQQAVIAAAVIVVLLIIGRFFGKTDDSANYSWDRVTQGTIRETITASGDVRAKTQSNIGTSTAGEIKAIYVKDGQYVNAGDLLMVIDNVRVSAQLESVKKDSERLKNQSERLALSFSRAENLFKEGLMSDEEFRNQRNNRDAALLSYQASVKNIESAQDTVNKAILRAPISGRVTGLRAEKGETAIPGMSNVAGALLMVISDMSHMQAEIKVNESEVVRIKVGQAAQVNIESFPGLVFQGTVEEVATGTESNQAQGNLYKVKIGLEAAAKDIEQLRPGMSARATILTSEIKDTLQVPLQAVIERFGTMEEAQKMGFLSPQPKYVVMAYEKGRAVEKPITTGISSSKFYEIKSGLTLGMQVITGPSKKLKDLKDKAKVALRKKSDEENANSFKDQQK